MMHRILVSLLAAAVLASCWQHQAADPADVEAMRYAQSDAERQRIQAGAQAKAQAQLAADEVQRVTDLWLEAAKASGYWDCWAPNVATAFNPNLPPPQRIEQVDGLVALVETFCKEREPGFLAKMHELAPRHRMDPDFDDAEMQATLHQWYLHDAAARYGMKVPPGYVPVTAP